MALFDNFPWTNVHELNLDWIIKKLAEVQNNIDNVIDDAQTIVSDASTYVEQSKQNADNAQLSADDARTSATNAQTYANSAYDATVGLAQDVAALDARMDTFTQLTEGSTTGDAELQDIRVEYNGTVAATAGDAVRRQVSDLWTAALKLYTTATALKTTYSNTLANINENLVFSADTEWTDLPKTIAGLSQGGLFINLRYSNAYNLNLLITTGSGEVFKRIVTRSSHAVFTNWTPVGVSPTGKTINGSTANDICLSDFNNLPSNMIYVVSITHADAANIANLPTKGKLCRGLLITSGKDYRRANTDSQLFIAQYGQYIAWRTYWSGWTEWNYLGAKPLATLCVGDSIAYGGRNEGLGFIGQFHFYPTHNDSVVGASLSTVRSVTTIPEQLIASTSHDIDYDIVIADGGINDYVSNAALGSVPSAPVTTDAADSSLDLTTVSGGVQHLFYNMIKLYPNAQKFFVITHRTLNYPSTNNSAGYTQTDLHDLIVALARLYGVKVIDVFNDSTMNTAFSQYISPTPYASDNSVTDLYWCDNDGIHPLAFGYLNGYVPLVRQALELATVK